MSATVNVKVGFAPSYRRFSDWCRKMGDDSLATLAQVKRLETVVVE